jgi:hypothetical protein
MKKTFSTVLFAALTSASLYSAPALAQVEVVVEPPPAFLATAEPVYFEGRAAYWYGGRWFYRDGRAWRNYREEPGYLREWRGHREPARQYYGREHGGGYRRR